MAAFVEVVFDNSDGRLTVEMDEVVLRRTIGLKKDEFFLNRKRVTKGEVGSLRRRRLLLLLCRRRRRLLLLLLLLLLPILADWSWRKLSRPSYFRSPSRDWRKSRPSYF